MSIPVKLQAFEGPLDLLLYLIDKNKINIYDIPIAEITDQYLEYINNMEIKDMDVMSEFLVMAATLINIKSRMLLPSTDNESEEDIDPRQELVDKLLEYKMFKYVSDKLRDKQEDASRVLFKNPTIPDEIADYKEEIDVNELIGDLTLSKLHEIFNSIIKKQSNKIDPIRSKFGKIEKEEINLGEIFIHIQEYGIRHKVFYFRNLLDEQTTKMGVIVTFLGILELIKQGRVKIEQEYMFDDIKITYLASNIIKMEEAGF
ncbi:MAG: segregation/condensation protein A [Clostridiales bacterium]|nr:segregation/condensation protein A [Clostridiales bacterium]